MTQPDRIPRVVADTDVVLSGLRSATGASRLLLRAIRAGAVTVIASVAIMLEYEAVLKRPTNLAAMGATLGDMDTFLDGLALLAEPVAPGFMHRPSIRDADDEMFVEAAINSQADALVTFNQKDYLPIIWCGIPPGVNTVRPGDFLRTLTRRLSRDTDMATF